MRFNLEQLEARGRKRRRRLLRAFMSPRFNSPLDQNPVGGGGPAPTPAAAPTPQPQPTSPPPAAPSMPASQPTPQPSSAAGPGTSGLPVPGATPAPAAPAQPGGWPAAPGQPAPQQQFGATFEDQFRQRYGMDPTQAQMLMQMGYQQYRGSGGPQTSLQPQPGQQPAQQQPATNAFGLPQFNYQLLQFVSKDPQTGRLVNLPGAPVDAAWQVEQFQEKLREVQQNFFADPEQYLGKLIDSRAEAKAKELYQQQFGQHQSQTTAAQLVRENESWLYSRDANGNVQQQWDPQTGGMAPVLSQWGNLYRQSLQQVANSGVSDIRMQHQMATQMVENAAMRARLQQQQPANPANPQAQAFLQQQVQPGQQPVPLPGYPAAPTPVPQNPPMPISIKDRMRAQFEQNGINDQVLQQQLNRNGA